MPDRLSRNTLTLLTSNVGSAGLSFLLSVLIARALGEGGFGAYAVALAWIFPLTLAAEFGIGTLITRDVAADPATGPDYLHATTIPRLLLGGAAVLALWVCAPLLSHDPLIVAGLRLSSPLLLIQPFFGAFTAIFRAESAMWPIPWLNLGMLVAQVAVTAAVFLNGGGVIEALAVNVITSAGQLAAAWAIYYRRFRKPVSGKPLPIGPLLRRAWPFALAAILAALQMRIGTILLEWLANTGEAGYYAAAARFVEAGRMIPNAYFGALFPALAGLVAQPGELERVFRRAAFRLSAFGVTAAGTAALLAGPILGLTYGSDFAPAAPVLQIMMIALLASLLRGLLTLYGYAQKREGYVNAVSGALLVAQVVLSTVLIPPLGALGVALAGLFAETVAVILLWRVREPLRRVSAAQEQGHAAL